MAHLELGKKVNIREHAKSKFAPCAWPHGFVIQLATELDKEIIRCEDCGSEDVIYEADRSAGHFRQNQG